MSVRIRVFLLIVLIQGHIIDMMVQESKARFCPWPGKDRTPSKTLACPHGIFTRARGNEKQS